MRGRLKPATIKDIAREADVSVASVSRTLNGVGRVGMDTRARILETAERLRYIPNEGARSLINRRTEMIGVVLPDLHGEFFSELLRGADAAARAHGLHLLVSTSHGDPDEAASAIRSMRGRVDGMLLMSPHLDCEFIARNLVESLPTVLMNSRPNSDAAQVNVEDYQGAVTMVRHLASVGGPRVAHIAGPAGNYDASERLRGYLDARPIDPGADYVVAGDFTVESGFAAGQLLARLDPLPDAIFAGNDMMAAGCLEAFEQLGIRVPDEIALGGFDDVPLAHFLRPSLTTMRVNVADMGRQALEQLVAALDDPLEARRGGPAERLVPQLIIRDSCGQSRREPITPDPNDTSGRTT